jgi:hypothetical protein
MPRNHLWITITPLVFIALGFLTLCSLDNGPVLLQVIKDRLATNLSSYTLLSLNLFISSWFSCLILTE